MVGLGGTRCVALRGAILDPRTSLAVVATGARARRSQHAGGSVPEASPRAVMSVHATGTTVIPFQCIPAFIGHTMDVVDNINHRHVM